jgi:hypothetical protein
MVIHLDQLPLDALAVVVTFGVGFLIWTLAHLFRESRPNREHRANLFISTHARH